MTYHREEIPLSDKMDSTVFVIDNGDHVMLTLSADRSQYALHMSAEAATKLAWAILRGAEFVNKHKQAEAA